MKAIEGKLAILCSAIISSSLWKKSEEESLIITYLSYTSILLISDKNIHSDMSVLINYFLRLQVQCPNKTYSNLFKLSFHEWLSSINALTAQESNSEYSLIRKLLLEVRQRQIERGVHPDNCLRAFSELRITQEMRQECLELQNKRMRETIRKRIIIGDDVWMNSVQNKKARQDDLNTVSAAPRP